MPFCDFFLVVIFLPVIFVIDSGPAHCTRFLQHPSSSSPPCLCYPKRSETSVVLGAKILPGWKPLMLWKLFHCLEYCTPRSFESVGSILSSSFEKPAEDSREEKIISFYSSTFPDWNPFIIRDRLTRENIFELPKKVNSRKKAFQAEKTAFAKDEKHNRRILLQEWRHKKIEKLLKYSHMVGEDKGARSLWKWHYITLLIFETYYS